MFGSIPLPYGFGVSGTLQNLPGPEILANWPASNAAVAPSLGRPLSGGARSVFVPLLGPWERREARISRVDLRVSKIVQAGDVRFTLNMDAYNAFNSNSIRRTTNNFGSRWRRPVSIMDPRIFQFTAQMP